jgi:hypothetical protein
MLKFMIKKKRLQQSCNIENLSLPNRKVVLSRVILLHIQKNVNLSCLRKKAHMLEINAAEQEKYRKSLSPEKKAHILEIHAAEQEKYQKSLSPPKKALLLDIHASKEKQMADRIKRYADTLTAAIDLDQATIEFLRVHFYKHPTLALMYFHCCSTDPCSAIFNGELGFTKDNTAMWNRTSKLIGSPIGQNKTVLCQQTFLDLN